MPVELVAAGTLTRSRANQLLASPSTVAGVGSRGKQLVGKPSPQSRFGRLIRNWRPRGGREQAADVGGQLRPVHCSGRGVSAMPAAEPRKHRAAAMVRACSCIASTSAQQSSTAEGNHLNAAKIGSVTFTPTSSPQLVGEGQVWVCRDGVR